MIENLKSKLNELLAKLALKKVVVKELELTADKSKSPVDRASARIAAREAAQLQCAIDRETALVRHEEDQLDTPEIIRRRELVAAATRDLTPIAARIQQRFVDSARDQAALEPLVVRIRNEAESLENLQLKRARRNTGRVVSAMCSFGRNFESLMKLAQKAAEKSQFPNRRINLHPLGGPARSPVNFAEAAERECKKLLSQFDAELELRKREPQLEKEVS